jgi:hypothetical protein
MHAKALSKIKFPLKVEVSGMGSERYIVRARETKLYVVTANGLKFRKSSKMQVAEYPQRSYEVIEG